ncbi:MULTISPECIES: ornithine cyclodeaminase family protein [Nitrospirillum]|uniref:Ornithine cyclodeaminase/alanine dehydrogenase-like protein (Mu-crystallin family) n=1 Tax=Nitrospirillum amazonense TaxID=28077 RepID=A0A560FKZ1_9PROT|nr:ornithine cyclodeaminase family protein [Nitrospirillum amazonense]MEC4590897.1 ornithine cyclodeaminase family protein [Nitrospirillum amazonense]TWB22278.1 ornithine cyclodeaminase/alanine dehydrogenase-like protein (mu-crystallin family) [Nitrospirillum amazonense]
MGFAPSGLAVFDAAAVRAGLGYGAAISAIRQAMVDLSTGRVRQQLRSFISLGAGRTFAIMPAAFVGADQPGYFGAKLVSVYNDGQGRKAHEGLVVLFDGASGRPVCLADAAEVTAMRTAAASAVATDALARPDADTLALVGIGRQALAHALALASIRTVRHIRVWGRDPAKTLAFAAQVQAATGIDTQAHDSVQRAVAGAAIVCTVTAAADPILRGDWIAPGTHVNVVGSSGPAQAEIDTDLVAASRFIVDHREHVLVHGGEFLRAKAAGILGDDHIAAEIGEVLAGRAPGRQSAEQITVYKSLGHAVQDLAATAWLYENARHPAVSPLPIIDGHAVAERLGYDTCIPLVRQAMTALSKGETQQLPRGVLPLDHGHMFGVMPGALNGGPSGGGPFGAKLVAVFPDNFNKGLPSHQGVIVLFDRDSGRPMGVVDGGEVTAIRTAAASAVATDALARPEASTLALLGYGEQALTHARAIARVRRLTRITVWGRAPGRAAAFAARLAEELDLSVRTAASAQEAVVDADIVCTVTAAKDPILHGAWVAPGTHVNVVGSSIAGPVEVDHDLVIRSRFIADCREHVLRQGAEFLRAKAAGLIDDAHVVAEIGEVLAGHAEGRQSAEQVTLYKSLGHVVQDLAAAWPLLKKD